MLWRAEKFCRDRATLSLPSCANDAMQPISIHRWKAWRNYDQDTKMKVVITYWNGANLEMCVCGGGVTPSPLFPEATSLVFELRVKNLRAFDLRRTLGCSLIFFSFYRNILQRARCSRLKKAISYLLAITRDTHREELG